MSADGITVSILCTRDEAARGSMDRRPSSNFHFNPADISFTKRTLRQYEDGTGEDEIGIVKDWVMWNTEMLGQDLKGRL